MTNSNNSGNSNNTSTGTGTTTGGTITIGTTGAGGGGGGNVAYIPYVPGNFTFTIGPGGWIGGTITVPQEATPAKEEKKKDNRDGCDCKKCKEFYPYAEPNQEDGTLICYACRHGY